MKMILKRKNAVSPVIATILLIALTVTAAAIVYFVVVPLLQSNPVLAYTEHGKVAGTSNKYEVTIVNNGGADANLAGLTAFTFTNTTDDYNPAHVYYSISTEVTTWPYVVAQGETVIIHSISLLPIKNDLFILFFFFLQLKSQRCFDLIK
ncbi:MAG: type IV pilin N-terminal domain-containing protein [Asgard group archaeon]|nr:type IV pilin N-terminal domain-containing protein [Asgard group archaeon]